jgi:hypothetical protein
LPKVPKEALSFVAEKIEEGKRASARARRHTGTHERRQVLRGYRGRLAGRAAR